MVPQKLPFQKSQYWLSSKRQLYEGGTERNLFMKFIFLYLYLRHGNLTKKKHSHLKTNAPGKASLPSSILFSRKSERLGFASSMIRYCAGSACSASSSLRQTRLILLSLEAYSDDERSSGREKFLTLQEVQFHLFSLKNSPHFLIS